MNDFEKKRNLLDFLTRVRLVAIEGHLEFNHKQLEENRKRRHKATELEDIAWLNEAEAFHIKRIQELNDEHRILNLPDVTTELVEALKEIVDSYSERQNPEWLERAKQTIAKAEGRQSV
jgi:hypothetical protein